MTTERVDRRLAAVLAADVAGYSRLMGANEEDTLARLKAVRNILVEPAITSHRGRIVKTTGDGRWWSLPAPMRCAVRLKSSAAWPSRPPCRRINGSNFAWAFTLVTSF